VAGGGGGGVRAQVRKVGRENGRAYDGEARGGEDAGANGGEAIALGQNGRADEGEGGRGEHDGTDGGEAIAAGENGGQKGGDGKCENGGGDWGKSGGAEKYVCARTFLPSRCWRSSRACWGW